MDEYAKFRTVVFNRDNMENQLTVGGTRIDGLLVGQENASRGVLGSTLVQVFVARRSSLNVLNAGLVIGQQQGQIIVGLFPSNKTVIIEETRI